MKGEIESGPAFAFPSHLDRFANVVLVRDINLLRRSFGGWTEEELPKRSPIVAVFEDNKPASICFCARVSEMAAEAGVETAPEFRGYGLAGIATSAWAAEIRESGRTPVYSTSWNIKPSLVVARKLGLVACASYWSIETPN